MTDILSQLVSVRHEEDQDKDGSCGHQEGARPKPSLACTTRMYIRSRTIRDEVKQMKVGMLVNLDIQLVPVLQPPLKFMAMSQDRQSCLISCPIWFQITDAIFLVNLAHFGFRNGPATHVIFCAEEFHVVNDSECRRVGSWLNLALSFKRLLTSLDCY